jgi:hypothetical protein
MVRWDARATLAHFIEGVPGFAVLLELRGLLFVVREESQGLHRLKGAGRKDVPDVFGNDVSDKDVNFVVAVRVPPMAAAAKLKSGSPLRSE